MIAGLYHIFDHWHREGTVWVFSDPHFGDKELRKGVPERPSDEELVKLINSKVGRKDTLIILGDVGDVSYVAKLRGYKVLICGNHDAGVSNYKRKITFYQKWVEDDFDYGYWARVPKDNHLFDEVYEGPLMISEKIILSHEPIDVPWAFNIHGHVHDPKVKDKKNQLNVCADVIGYVPVNFNQLMKKGIASKVDTIHRETIDKATKRKKARGGKKYGR